MSETPEMDGRKKSRRFDLANVAAATFLGLIFLAFIAYFLGPRNIGCRRTTESSTAIALESAVINFQTELGNIPDVGAHITTDSPEGIQLLTILLGMEPQTGKIQNTRGIKFLNAREGKNRKNSLIYSKSGTSIEGLFDRWGNPYTIELDTRNAGHLHFTLGNRTIDLKNRRVAAYSPGPDGKLGTEDDVLTW